MKFSVIFVFLVVSLFQSVKHLSSIFQCFNFKELILSIISLQRTDRQFSFLLKHVLRYCSQVFLFQDRLPLVYDVQIPGF